jgi:hypothetical protein
VRVFEADKRKVCLFGELSSALIGDSTQPKAWLAESTGLYVVYTQGRGG